MKRRDQENKATSAAREEDSATGDLTAMKNETVFTPREEEASGNGSADATTLTDQSSNTSTPSPSRDTSPTASGDFFDGGEHVPDDDANDADAADEEENEVVIHDADAEDAAELVAAARAVAARRQASAGTFVGDEALGDDDEVAPGGGVRSMADMMAIIESLIFVSEEPLSAKTLAEVLKEERGWVAVAVDELAKEFNERNGGLMIREVAGGWQFATRPEHHEHIRAFLKSRPSARLSLAALETLAVISYKQPITVPEILEIRGVQSSSAIKTLLDKRLIKACGRKETVGRPMLYGTSKEFLMQFGLKDLSELPSIEDFEDLASGS